MSNPICKSCGVEITLAQAAYSNGLCGHCDCGNPPIFTDKLQKEYAALVKVARIAFDELTKVKGLLETETNETKK